VKHKKRWILVGLLVASLPLSACTQAPTATASENQPAVVEPINGSEFSRVRLTDKAAERLAIQTAPVRDEQVGGVQRKVVPYAAVIYGLNGETWTYTNPEPLVFIREEITIERIDGDKAIVTAGPPAGTAVVTAGGAELFGEETGVGH
jgi:ABC-type oligopeptide transport system substrate-binding subunit